MNWIPTPRMMFLLDGIGGLISAFALGIVFIPFQAYIGMPISTLTILAFIACCFAGYSLGCYFKFPKKWKPFLRFVMIANSIYCLLTLSLVIRFWSALTSLGIGYFILEILVIFGVVFLENKVLWKY